MDNFGNKTAARMLKDFCGSRTGIVQNYGFVEQKHYEPNIEICYSMIGNTEKVIGEKATIYSASAAFNKEQAFIKAVGESLERYSCACINSRELKRFSFNNLKNQGALDPKTIELFNKHQYSRFSFSPFTRNSIAHWTLTESLVSGGKIFVPGFLVYSPFRHAGTNNFTPTYTTGLAFHTNKEAAILNGIYEVIERDAFTIYWLNRVKAPRFEVSGVEVREAFKFDTLRYFLFDLTSDVGIPVVAAYCFGKQENGGPLVSLGLGADLELRTATVKALMECALSRPAIRNLIEEGIDKGKSDFRSDYQDIDSFEDASCYYSLTDGVEKLKWIHEAEVERTVRIALKKEESASGRRKSIALRKAVSRLSKKGFDILVKDITSPDIKAKGGYYTYRTIINGLVGIYANPLLANLGNKRLYKAAEVFPGIGENRKEWTQFNLTPHPLG